jgi:flagellar assembly protein FliH
MAAVSTLRNIELVPDASLERGAAIFETTRGNLDASIETQLREIERGFTDLVRSHR